MAKRFTDSAKFRDPWFRQLAPSQKLGYLYLLDECDQAGVVDLDRALADFSIGEPVDWEGLIEASEGRLEGLSGRKLWVVKFIGFQYGELSEDCRAHKPAFDSLRKHGLTERVLEGYSNAIDSVPVIVKDKDKDKVKVKEKRFQRPSIEAIREFARESKLPDHAAEFSDYYESNGWKVGKNSMKDWQATYRNWCRRQKGFGNGSNSRTPGPGQEFDPSTVGQPTGF